MLPCGLYVRSDLHLTEFQRVLMTFPFVPIYAFSMSSDLATFIVLAIQVGSVAFCRDIPPGTFVHSRTKIFLDFIVVPVLSAEHPSNMASQAITCTVNTAAHLDDTAVAKEFSCFRCETRCILPGLGNNGRGKNGRKKKKSR